MTNSKPTLFTSLSPALLHLYELTNAAVVIIDVLRATSTIATALYNGATSVIPVDNIGKCIEIGNDCKGITAGERDGKVAEGLQYGNSPFEYPRNFIEGKKLVLTTTNGTKLLRMAAKNGASCIITGSFPNITAVCNYLISQNQSVVLGCAGWKGRINMEDTLFAGAVVERVKEHFIINCDSSMMAETLYLSAKSNMYAFLETQHASHYHRLKSFGLEKDIEYCLTQDVADVLPFFENGELIIRQ